MASILYDYFRSTWRYGTSTEADLQMAVERGYITAEEKEQIMSEPQL